MLICNIHKGINIDTAKYVTLHPGTKSTALCQLHTIKGTNNYC